MVPSSFIFAEWTEPIKSIQKDRKSLGITKAPAHFFLHFKLWKSLIQLEAATKPYIFSIIVSENGLS